MFAWNVNILHRCPVAILDYVHHIDNLSNMTRSLQRVQPFITILISSSTDTEFCQTRLLKVEAKGSKLKKKSFINMIDVNKKNHLNYKYYHIENVYMYMNLAMI